MGSEFLVYLRLGIDHLANLQGYDHILFIAALSLAYPLRMWRHLLWLVTAFTVGHSITLALATLDLVRVNDALIEFLIPLTIFLVSLLNIAEKPQARRDDGATNATRFVKYGLALSFGLIHGLGFSNYLRAVLGGEESIALPLLAFNIGLELGQLAILFVLLLLTVFMVRVVKMERRSWVLVLSGATAGIALTMMLDRLPG